MIILKGKTNKKAVGRVLIHPKYRHAHVDPERAKGSSISAPPPSPTKPKLRSNQPTFQRKTH